MSFEKMPIYFSPDEGSGGSGKNPEKGKESLDINQLQKDFEDLSKIEKLERKDIEPDLDKVLDILQNEPENIRPKDKNGQPGGLIELKKDIPTILIPDLHGRRDILLNILNDKDEQGITNLEKLLKGQIQIVALGDALHREDIIGEDRWPKAFEEQIKSGKSVTPTMEEEIADSFGTMVMIMKLKELSPENFHYLRGNHDDTNETYTAFRKFARESTMVKNFIKEKYGEDFLKKYAEFEENLPLLARGNKFLASHAYPAALHPEDPGDGINSTIKRALNYREERGNRDDDSAFNIFCWTRLLHSQDEGMIKNEHLQAQGITYFYGHEHYDPLAKMSSKRNLVATNALVGYFYFKVDPNGNYEHLDITQKQKPSSQEQPTQSPEKESKSEEPQQNPEQSKEKTSETQSTQQPKPPEKPPENAKIKEQLYDLIEKATVVFYSKEIDPSERIELMGEYSAQITKLLNIPSTSIYLTELITDKQKLNQLIDKIYGIVDKEKETPKPEVIQKAAETVKKEEKKGKESFFQKMGGWGTIGGVAGFSLLMFLILIFFGELKLLEKTTDINIEGGGKSSKK